MENAVTIEFLIEGDLPPEFAAKATPLDPWDDPDHLLAMWSATLDASDAERMALMRKVEELERDQEATDRALQRAYERRRPNIESRLIRLRDAPTYLCMDKNRFNTEVRPHVLEIPIGTQGVAFDRFDLDEWCAKYKARNGRPGKTMKGASSWEGKSRQDLSRGGKSGTSRRQSTVIAFEKALARVTSKKQSGI